MPFQEFGSFRRGPDAIKHFRDLTIDTLTLTTEQVLSLEAVIRSNNYEPGAAGFALKADGTMDLQGNLAVGGSITLDDGGQLKILAPGGADYLTAEDGGMNIYHSGDIDYNAAYMYFTITTEADGVGGEDLHGAIDYTGAPSLVFRNSEHSNFPASASVELPTGGVFWVGNNAAPASRTNYMKVSSSQFFATPVYAATSANPANVYVSSTGQLYRSTVSGGSFDDGTAGAPSITFTNDTDTGIYRYAPNAIGFTTGGTMDAYFSGGYLYIPSAYSGTTSLAPNMYITSSGQFYRSTFTVSNFTSAAHTSAHTAIQSVYPSANNTYGLGWSSFRWRDVYLVGGTTAGSTDIHINASTGQLLQVTSSKRFKKHIKDYNGGLELLTQMRPRSFQWKKGMDDGNNVEGTQHIGMIAEELVEVAPEYVNLDEDGTPWSIRYSALVVPLLQAVQELNQRLTNVEQRGTV